VNPQFPIYIVSKGRADSRYTSRALEVARVPYFIVVEEQEHAEYAKVIDPAKILVLDKAYQRKYDTFDDLGDTKSKGPGPARNFAWDHSIAAGADWHWVMDDNIKGWYRLHENRKIFIGDGTAFACMEDFCLRYMNVAMAGPNYATFVPAKRRFPPFILNTRIYSCNLIRNDTPFRWRGRYNEDTDLSLRMLKGGWCTIQFDAFLQRKTATQMIKGGNTAEFYAKEGTLAKSQMQVRMHPDVSRLRWAFGRVHHYVDYKPFQKTPLVRRRDIEWPTGVDDYGMVLKTGYTSGPCDL